MVLQPTIPANLIPPGVTVTAAPINPLATLDVTVSDDTKKQDILEAIDPDWKLLEEDPPVGGTVTPRQVLPFKLAGTFSAAPIDGWKPVFSGLLNTKGDSSLRILTSIAAVATGTASMRVQFDGATVYEADLPLASTIPVTIADGISVPDQGGGYVQKAISVEIFASVGVVTIDTSNAKQRAFASFTEYA